MRLVDAIYEMENLASSVMSLGLIPSAPSKHVDTLDDIDEETESLCNDVRPEMDSRRESPLSVSDLF